MEAFKEFINEESYLKLRESYLKDEWSKIVRRWLMFDKLADRLYNQDKISKITRNRVRSGK